MRIISSVEDPSVIRDIIMLSRASAHLASTEMIFFEEKFSKS
jgi:hypothetical protein